MDKLAPTTVDPLSKANLYDGINTNLATLKYAPPQFTKISVLRFRAPGGEGGIGFHITFALVQAGYHLTIGDSDTDLALEAVETIKTQTKNPQAEFMYVNLASLEDICKLVNEIEQHASVIDMLVNRTTLRAITEGTEGQDLEAISGKYWLDEHIRPCNPIARDAELQEELEM
ncbi:hypothetical protein BGZ92_002153 [Podila epicladia]|nr:hypothetical protein BGZ92_002153 [Podila epicladia]